MVGIVLADDRLQMTAQVMWESTGQVYSHYRFGKALDLARAPSSLAGITDDSQNRRRVFADAEAWVAQLPGLTVGGLFLSRKLHPVSGLQNEL
ncbi:unnamed protein product [Polarella glacialis]|uniref:Uncharacterized protein n=1 Tax=Polarella glacialis TaxID=89957 RepID=A0A813EY19_POLGL|nr:unnamed protein product [Polarella glacialis]